MSFDENRCKPSGLPPLDDSMKCNIIGISDSEPYDAIEPPHYQRGPRIYLPEGSQEGDWYDIQCIDVFEEIKDPRLATAFKYIWRVAFGGKAEPWDSRIQEERDSRDINSAVWYLNRYLAKMPERQADSAQQAYDVLTDKVAKLEKELAERPVKTVTKYIEPKTSGIDID